MTQETINRLMELKQLLEAGILTPEEVEAEKKKILTSQQAQTTNKGPEPEVKQPEEPMTEIAPTSAPQYASENNNPVNNEYDEEDTESDDQLRICLLTIIVVCLFLIIIFACVSQCS